MNSQGLDKEDESLPLQKVVENFLKDIKTFRKPLTHQKYEYVLELFAEHASPKSDARDIAPEGIKKFLAWRKSKGFDPGTTLYTDRVILHNFFNKLGIDNPVKKVPRLPKFRKRPVASRALGRRLRSDRKPAQHMSLSRRCGSRSAD